MANILFNDFERGYISTQKIAIDSSKQLANLISEWISDFKQENAEGTRCKIRITELNSDSGKGVEFITPDNAADEMYKKSMSETTLIQPVMKELTVIRAFYIPPKPKIFICKYRSENYGNQSDSEREEPRSITIMREGSQPVLEEQYRHLFVVFEATLFNPVNLQLKGISFDFVEQGSI